MLTVAVSRPPVIPCKLMTRIERAPHLVSDRVDGLALGTAIMMIDAVALIVTLHEAGLDELRDRAAHVRASGETDSLLDFGCDQPCGDRRVGGKLIALLEFRSNLVGDRKATGVAPGHGHQGIA